MGWEIFVHSVRGKYCLSAFTSETRPPTDTKMITLSHRNTLVIPEKPFTWETVQQDLNPNEFNPLDNLSPSINSLFLELFQTPRALLDKYVLPMVELQLHKLFLRELLLLSAMALI